MFYYWTLRWRQSPIHCKDSCSVAFEAKDIHFTAMKIPWSPTEPHNIWCSAWLTWMGIKLFNCVGFLDFANVNWPNGSNYNRELGHFVGGCDAKKIYPPFYKYFFHSGSVGVFSSGATVSGTYMTWDEAYITLQIKIKALLVGVVNRPNFPIQFDSDSWSLDFDSKSIFDY